MNEYEHGILYAAGIVVASHGNLAIAADIIRSAGMHGFDCSQLERYDKNNLLPLKGELGLKGL